jgi:hypothetical protein
LIVLWQNSVMFNYVYSSLHINLNTTLRCVKHRCLLQINIYTCRPVREMRERESVCHIQSTCKTKKGGYTQSYYMNMKNWYDDVSIDRWRKIWVRWGNDVFHQSDIIINRYMIHRRERDTIFLPFSFFLTYLPMQQDGN